MKTNHISEAVKILIVAATIIVVCVLCAIGFKISNEGKSIVSQGTSNLNAMQTEYQDINKSIYDGNTILGSELVSLIKKSVEKGEYLSIVVKTLANVKEKNEGTHYNYEHSVDSEGHHIIDEGSEVTQIASNKGDKNYINPGAQFLGTVYKDINNNVICIEFVQQE